MPPFPATPDAILFSARRSQTDVLRDALPHLATHAELYWTVGFRFSLRTLRDFHFPLLIHITGRSVEYRALITKILPFDPAHYTDPKLKPYAWRAHPAAATRASHHSLVLSTIQPFAYETLALRRLDGQLVRVPPMGFTRVTAAADARDGGPACTPRRLNLADDVLNSAKAILATPDELK